MQTELVVSAVEMAVRHRRSALGVIHHSDSAVSTAA